MPPDAPSTATLKPCNGSKTSNSARAEGGREAGLSHGAERGRAKARLRGCLGGAAARTADPKPVAGGTLGHRRSCESHGENYDSNAHVDIADVVQYGNSAGAPATSA